MQQSSGPIAAAKRIVIKVGSSLLVEDGAVNTAWLSRFAADLKALADQGKELAVVSSGAVGLGRAALGDRLGSLADRQAAAAVGQIRLSEAYRSALQKAGLQAAQVLLTPSDTEDRRRHLNARATMEALLARSVVAIINENDTVATQELKFGDNDRLAARVAQLVSADLLILLSDVDGLYDRDPRRSDAARHIPDVRAVTPALEAMAGAAGSTLGTGGMAAKLAAARIALAGGTRMAIADGRAEGALAALAQGARATWFHPALAPMTARKAWIAATVAPKGRLRVDAGAADAVAAGKSLLAVGVTRVEGAFVRGDPVAVLDAQGHPLGTGLVNYDINEAARIAGRRSSAFAALLGYAGPDCLIHRDNLALTQPLGAKEPV